MGKTFDAIVCLGFVGLRLTEYTENIWTPTGPTIFYIYLWYHRYNAIHSRNDREDAYTWNTKSERPFSLTIKHKTPINICIISFVSSMCTEIITGWRAIFSWSLVSIRCDNGCISMDFDYVACVRIAGSRTEIFVFIGIAGTTAADYDTILACILEIFDAEKSNQSNIQVSRPHFQLLHKSPLICNNR